MACFFLITFQACKWSNYKIPLSAQNKEWYVYVDPTATHDLLEELTAEFLAIYKQCPSRLKKKIKASTQAVSLCCKLHNTTLPGRYLNMQALKIWPLFEFVVLFQSASFLFAHHCQCGRIRLCALVTLALFLQVEKVGWNEVLAKIFYR